MDFFSVSWQIMTETEGMERIPGGKNKHVRQEIYAMRHCLYAVVWNNCNLKYISNTVWITDYKIFVWYPFKTKSVVV